MRTNILFFIILIILQGTYMTDAATPILEKPKEQSDAPAAVIAPPTITKHSLTINGKAINYTATTGYMKITDEDGKHKANIFYIAYTKDGEKAASRPITYTFNGGPGSSSVWLHLGALGPKRVLLADDGNALPPPFKVVDNEYSWLDFTDLVFIDPVGTGYSRPAKDEKPEQFHGIDEDIKSVGDFIRRYTTQNKRWLSPKFLAGESYGTTRAAGLSGYLQQSYGMTLNGIVLISTVLQFQTLRFAAGNDMPYWLYLPAYTATSWYHKRLSADLQANLKKTVDEVRAWSLNEYLLALTKGDALTVAEKSSIAEKLAHYTGLSKEYILNSNLRLDIHRYTKELLRSERRTVGRLDSRFKGIDYDAAGENPDYDPSYDAVILGPFTAAMNDYVRTTLEYENDLPYEILTGKVHPWNWGSGERGFPNVAETLREAMCKNHNLRVFVANGYFDLATPFSATEYTMNHLGLEAPLHDNIQMEYYESGHMMYIHKESLVKFTRDVAKFLTSSIYK